MASWPGIETLKAFPSSDRQPKIFPLPAGCGAVSLVRYSKIDATFIFALALMQQSSRDRRLQSRFLVRKLVIRITPAQDRFG
jgi:hypothetical protein